MAFHPEHLPPTVYEIYKKGPSMWMFAVQAAIPYGITNSDTLTNMAFYMHHPELDGRPLRKDETKLIAEWKSFRTKIKPLVPIWVKVYSASEPINISSMSELTNNSYRNPAASPRTKADGSVSLTNTVTYDTKMVEGGA